MQCLATMVVGYGYELRANLRNDRTPKVETLWKVHQLDGVTPGLAWSIEMFGGAVAGRKLGSPSLVGCEFLLGRVR